MIIFITVEKFASLHKEVLRITNNAFVVAPRKYLQDA